MNATSLGYPFIRRRDTIIDENAMQHLLLHESIWSHAFASKWRIGNQGKERRRGAEGIRTRSTWKRVLVYLQLAYEKSRIQSLFPILLLFAYSILGGFIFWSIEKPSEESLLIDKALYIEGLKEELVNVLMEVHFRLKAFNETYSNNTHVLGLYHRAYRRYALNRIHRSVYWYTLSAFYLTEHEMHKALALRPQNPEDIWQKHFESNFGRIAALKNYTDQLSLRCWELGVEGVNEEWLRIDYEKKINETILNYNMAVGLEHVLTPVWTFWNSVFLAVTTYSTIGYGNITAKTKLGKLAAMVYAVIGIPLALMILHRLGRICLRWLDKTWDFVMRGAQYLCFVSRNDKAKMSTEDRISEMPLVLAIGVAFGWIFLCAAIFLHFEKDWDYFKSFYFFFCSLTTIGYGDITPTNSEDLLYIMFLIIIGLSLVSMCINIIQLKLEKLFEELILTLMEEYSSASPEAQRLKEGRLSMMEMWRVWKKRKERLRHGLQRAATTRQFNYRQAAERAGENIAKIFPFSWRRERRHLIAEFQKRLRRKDKATQTDDPFMPTFEEACTETSDVDSFCTSQSFHNHHLHHNVATARSAMLNDLSPTENTCKFLFIPDGPMLAPSRCESRPVVAQQEPSICSSSSHPTTGSVAISVPIGSELSTSSSNSNRISPRSKSSLSTYSIHQCSCSSSSSRQAVRSAPSASPARPPVDFDPNRRWTFVASHYATRGAPRGLVPYMYTKPMSNVIHTNEIRRLISEIEARVQECRDLASSSSRGSTPPIPSIRASVSGTSLTRSIVPQSTSPSPSLQYPPPLPIPNHSQQLVSSSSLTPILPSHFRTPSGRNRSFLDADAASNL